MTTNPATHIDIAIGSTRTSRIDIEANSCVTRFAHSTAATGDVERYGDEVTLLDKLDIAAKFDDLTGDLVSQGLALRSGGAATHHMLITATNIGCYDPEDDAVVAFAILFRQL